MKSTLILASQSPRRIELLKLAGYKFRQVSVQLSEISDENLNPRERIRQLALAKAKACLDLRISSDVKDFGLLTADTLVVLGDQTLGKPKDQFEACQMLSQLSGARHRVITALVLYNSSTRDFIFGEAETVVQFRKLSEAEIQSYVESGDPFDKAGGYGIQGEARKFVESVEGPFDNVVGFPTVLFEQLKSRSGMDFDRSEFSVENLRRQLKSVQKSISVALDLAARPEGAVRLIAVSKTKPTEAVVNALRAGQLRFGENYVQEAVSKQKQVADALDLLGHQSPRPEWHFIGQLQTNKVKDVVGRFALIHSVDRLKLAQVISKKSQELGIQTRVLLQVNIGDEDAKGGVSSDQYQDLMQSVLQLPNITVCGLMCMPPLAGDPSRFFQKAKALFEQARSAIAEPDQAQAFCELSMGTTHDFPLAIQSGSTLIRVGTAVFGERA